MSSFSIGRCARGFAALSALLLTSCGGGDSGSQPQPGPPPAADTAPRFTSGTTASVTENDGTVFYTATATDAEGDAIGFSIQGGADAAKFVIGSAGGLQFASPADFEIPGDADRDNVYSVILRASAGGKFTDQALTVTLDNDSEGISVTRVATGFGTDAVIGTAFKGTPGFVVRQDGQMYQISPDGTDRVPRGKAFLTGETGRVMSVAYFNSHIAVMLDIAGKGVFVRFFPQIDVEHSYRQIQLAEASNTEALGQLHFANGGQLYASLGDPTGDAAQDPDSGYGKIFALDNARYCGASLRGGWCTGKWVKADGVHAPVGAGSFDQLAYLVDRGTDRKDEITVYSPNWVPLDFGWPFYEGDVAIRENAPARVNGPSLVIERSDRFIGTTGLVGAAIFPAGETQLSDKLIMGDLGGKIFAFPKAELIDSILHDATEVENRTADFTPDIGTIDSPRGIIRDAEGRMFILDADGELFLVQAS